MIAQDFPGADDEIVYAVFDSLNGRAPNPGRVLDRMWDVTGSDTAHKAVDLIEQYFESRQGQDHYGDLNRREYVEHLYEDVLDRPADSTGLNYWIAALRAGSERAEVAMHFVLSEENLAKIGGVLAAGDVARLYHGLLDRAPDAEGLHYYRDAIAHGSTLSDVAEMFLNSAEYRANHVGLSDTAYLQNLYEHALGRQAEKTGLEFWEGQLGHGASRASVASAIADSVEAHYHMASQVAEAWHI
ncbi:DUF4214 domain-containing protein [Methylobacterium durans]|uniref:DUF4214 domain-containing protein n=1 Tax=Methylobacterium durans TaxID=2202825 RepID=A0A2U8W8S1_9HYPH|nr:DUF4214 domain-containing protein [Methylobacterium durans]AWN41716.1 hypothetical protein DK389_15870 [Methylobacterium durans]